MAYPPELTRPLEWSDAFSVGDDVLDAEHRSLIVAINNFHISLSQDDIEYRRTLFQSLVLLAQHHFDHENSVLRKIVEGGPEIAVEAKSVGEAAIREHIDGHKRALDQLMAMARNIDNNRTEVSRGFYNTLKAWFIDHAVNHDSHLKTVLQAL